MPTEGPRLTDERLRHHLDGNQPMRERLCLALMPIIGPYSRERPRRPKGGPDGGRDIEAIYEGKTVVWGAIGFRNGGGNDAQARRESSQKFEEDLESATGENPDLRAFVFFTNVDLTPGIVEKLKSKATAAGISLVDIVDAERMRHALDSSEGLIARLQYLDIPMSPTEQVALVNKFGNELQNAVASRFDRVERTLNQMERFLDFQKPIHRLDVYVNLDGEHTSTGLGAQGVLVHLAGLPGLEKSTFVLLWNDESNKHSGSHLVNQSHLWLADRKDKILSFPSTLASSLSTLAAYCELQLKTAGHLARIADLVRLELNVYITEGLVSLAKQLIVDANGYELFKCELSVEAEEANVEIPNSLPVDTGNKKWYRVVNAFEYRPVYVPPVLSGRFQQLRTVE